MNNFDTSSEGVNLELNCFYDIDLSRMYFDNQIQKDDRSDYYIFGDDSHYDVFDMSNYDFTKKDLLDCCVELGIFSDDTQAIIGRTISRCTKSDLIDSIEHYHGNGLVEFWIENLNPKFEIITSRGYSQGDEVEVIIPHTLDFKPTQKHVSNLLWSYPIYCVLTIDDDDKFYFDENMIDSYDYDRDEVLKIATKQINHEKKDYILKWLGDNLPNVLEYV